MNDAATKELRQLVLRAMQGHALPTMRMRHPRSEIVHKVLLGRTYCGQNAEPMVEASGGAGDLVPCQRCASTTRAWVVLPAASRLSAAPSAGALERCLPVGWYVVLPNGDMLDSSCPVQMDGLVDCVHLGTTPAGGPDPTEYDARLVQVWAMDEDGGWWNVSDASLVAWAARELVDHHLGN